MKGVSKELQIGKAGEHLVCCDLIKQGYHPFLADQGMPYDVVVDAAGRLHRIQVKTTQSLVDRFNAPQIYCYTTRRGRAGEGRVDSKALDFFAFVALDIMVVAYVPIADMVRRNGSVRVTVIFKSRRATYSRRVYGNGTVQSAPLWGRHIEDHARFSPAGHPAL